MSQVKKVIFKRIGARGRIGRARVAPMAAPAKKPSKHLDILVWLVRCSLERFIIHSPLIGIGGQVSVLNIAY
jgi:hypothetical protein